MFDGPEVAGVWSPEAPGVLLGLRPGADVSSEVVLGALRGRMAELAAHPMAMTAQGEHMKRLIQGAASRVMLGNTVVPPRLPSIAGRDLPRGEGASTATPSAAASVSQTMRATGVPAAPARAMSTPPAVPAAMPAARTQAPQRAEVAGAPAASVETAQDPLVLHARRVLAQHGGPTPAAVAEITMQLVGAGRPASAVNQLIALAMNATPGPGGGGASGASLAARGQGTLPVSAVGSDGRPIDESAERSANERPSRRVGAEEDPTARLLGMGLLIGGAALVAVVGAVLLLTMSLGGGAATSPGATGAAGAGQTAAVPTPGGGSPESSPTAAATPAALAAEPMATGANVSAGDVSRRLVAAAARISTSKEEGLRSASSALAAASTSWDSMSPGDRVAVSEALVELVYKAAGDDALLADVLKLLDPPVMLDEATTKMITPADIRPTAFASGAFWRLSRERELPGAAMERVRASFTRILGGARPSSSPGFAGGASEALRLMPLRIVQRSSKADARMVEASMLRWVEVVRAVSPADVPKPDAGPVVAGAPSESDAILVDALARLLVDGPDPSESEPAYRAILNVSRALRWDGVDQSRGRLGMWLGDPRISTTRLNLVTGAIVKLVRVDGLDDTFVLPVGASSEQRAAIRDAYVSAWSLTGASRATSGAETWGRAITVVLGEPGPDNGDDLGFAVVAAQFNHSAVLRAAGKIDEGIAIASAIQPPPPVIINAARQDPTGAAINAAGGLADDSWASRYLCGDRSVAVRLQRIRELQDRAPEITQLDADVLVEIAFVGSPPEVSAAALKAIPSFGASAQMTHALLKMASRAPRREAIGRMVEQMTYRPVPPVYSDRWAFMLRRALVERLIEQMASQTWAGRVDGAMIQLAEAYGGMATGSTSPTPDVEKASQELMRSIERYGNSVRTQAAALVPNQALGLSLDQIDRRRQARRVVALGPVQVFAAEQVTLLETLSYIAAAERPESATLLAENLTHAAEQRRRAKSILTQLRVVEQAISRVWAERMGVATQPLKAEPSSQAPASADPAPAVVPAPAATPSTQP